MKNLILTFIAVLLLHSAFAQGGNAPYKQNPQLPEFQLEQVNNKTFNTSQLKKNVPTVIMFFSPGCDHCIKQFEDMVKRMNELKKYHIIMATYQPLEELDVFNKKYNIARYPNIITGQDAGYFLPPFYQISNFPYFAFYNKSGRLTGVFEGNTSVDNIIKKLN